MRKYASQLGISWVITFDADQQMDIEDMETFRSAIAHHPKVKAFL